jgi:uncharacterized protein YjbJ (UPF0337 family)
MSAKRKQWKGRIKQAAGTLTGRRKLEREGGADRRSGEAEERVDQAKGKLDETIDRAANAVKGALGIGEDGSPRK